MSEIDKRKSELVNRLGEEVKSLEYEVNNYKYINFKRKVISNLKITKNVTKYLMPFIISGTISIGGFHLIKNSDGLFSEKVEEKANYNIEDFYAYSYLLISLPIGFGIVYDQQKNKKFALREDNAKIRSNLKLIDGNDADKLLKIKRDNYEFIKK